jgi:death on curing protein
MSIIYLILDQAIETHKKTIEVRCCGAIAHLDLGKLGSVLHHILKVKL